MPNDITREARELCERATPGPWIPHVIEDDVDVIDRCIANTSQTGICCGVSSMQDAAFIARSRTLLPAVLDDNAAKDAEIARLRADRQRYADVHARSLSLRRKHEHTIRQLTAERDAAIKDMQAMALEMRESEEMPEGCCFACQYDSQNLPDNVFLAYGECPGYDRDDCFAWRGAGEGDLNG